MEAAEKVEMMPTVDPVGAWLGEIAEREVARWAIGNGWAVKRHSNLGSPTAGPPVLKGPNNIDWLLPDLELISVSATDRRAHEFWEVKYLRASGDRYILKTSKLREWQAVARFHSSPLRIAVVDSRSKMLRTHAVPSHQNGGDMCMVIDEMQSCGTLNRDAFSLELLARKILTARHAQLALLDVLQ